jgi:flagellar basal-body rod protein FlgC
MSGMFGAVDNARSGLGVYRQWLDAVGDNIANMNDVRRTSDAAFQARYLAVDPLEGGGARVSRVVFGDAAGKVVHEPSHPLADADGNVRYPDIDLGEQMVNLMIAQRGYQANLSVVDRVKDAYEQALQLGK